MPAAVLLVFTVKVEVIEPLTGGVTEEREKAQVAPVGHPEIERFTAELKLLTEVMVAVYVFPVESVWAIFWEEGEAERVKSGAAVTIKLKVVVLVKLPAVPVMVMG